MACTVFGGATRRMINVDSSCSGCMMVDAVIQCVCMLGRSIQMDVSVIRKAYWFTVP